MKRFIISLFRFIIAYLIVVCCLVLMFPLGLFLAFKIDVLAPYMEATERAMNFAIKSNQ